MPEELDPDSLVSAWNACHGAFLQVRPGDVRWNLREQHWLRYQIASWEGVPVLLAEAGAGGIQAGVAANTLWVSLYGKISSGRCEAFLLAMEERARAAAKLRLAIGGDEFHFLPGVPEHDELLPALRARGASLTACSDYAGLLSTSAIAAYRDQARALAAAEGWCLSRVETEPQKAALGAFMLREFPGRWEREWRFWNSQAGTGRAFWTILCNSAGELLGFARLGVRGRIHPPEAGWTPGALRMPLSPARGWAETDGCLGPIGISASARGKGMGKALLGLALAGLQDAGAELLAIDWTDAHGFYAPLALSEVRKWFSARISL